MKFYVGLHHPSDARHFERACLSVNVLRNRRTLAPNEWIMDSGAFTEISAHGHYRNDVTEYAGQIRRWADVGTLVAAVSQDWMCEPFIIRKTGLDVPEHQRLTVERYDALLDCGLPVVIMPVLQGFRPDDYRHHCAIYGDRIGLGAWVGVGSVCKRNGRPEQIAAVLAAIKAERPDLRLHGFGVKYTALCHPAVRQALYSADSMAWSFAARIEGRNQNDWHEAEAFASKIAGISEAPLGAWQQSLGL